MTDYLSAQDLIEVAQHAVGADAEVGDYGLLASAAARPQASAFGEDAYPHLGTKVAALLISLVRNHALIDGNKRLGLAAAVVFAGMNDLDLVPPTVDIGFDLVMNIASGQLGDDVGEVALLLAPWMTERS